MAETKTTEHHVTVFKASELATFNKVAAAIGQRKRIKKQGITYFDIKWKETEEIKK